MALPSPTTTKEGRHEWTLGGSRPAAMAGLAVAASVAGSLLFGSLQAALRPAVKLSLTVRPADPIWVPLGVILTVVAGPVLLTAVLLVLHEGCHGLAFRWVGASPHYGAKLIGRIVPILYATAPGHLMTRRQFTAVLLAPTLLINLLGLLLMLPPTPLRYLMVLPMGVHFGGCVGDWWMLLVLLRTPRGTLFEDTAEGLAYTVPPSRG